jgi:hypothetical protein
MAVGSLSFLIAMMRVQSKTPAPAKAQDIAIDADTLNVLESMRRSEARRDSIHADLERILDAHRQPFSPPLDVIRCLPMNGPKEAFFNFVEGVDVQDRWITINRKWFTLPIEKAVLISGLGAPREIESETMQLVWDDLGLGACCEPSTTRITKLILALHSKDHPHWPRKMVSGEVMLPGVTINEYSTRWSLNHSIMGTPAMKEWRLELKGYTATAQFNSDGTIESVIIDASR